jgi:hypothetical protein
LPVGRTGEEKKMGNFFIELENNQKNECLLINEKIKNKFKTLICRDEGRYCDSCENEDCLYAFAFEDKEKENKFFLKKTEKNYVFEVVVKDILKKFVMYYIYASIASMNGIKFLKESIPLSNGLQYPSGEYMQEGVHKEEFKFLQKKLKEEKIKMSSL